MNSINENAADEIVSHRLALLRYEAGTAKEMLAAYDVAFADLDAQMRKLAGRIARGESADKAQLVRLVSLGNDLDSRIRSLRASLAGTMDSRLAEAADAEAAFQSGVMRPLIHTRYRVPEEAVAEALTAPVGGRKWADLLDANLMENRDGIRRVLAIAQAKGASMPKIARALREGTGILETYRGRFVAIARTETQRVANDVAIATYEENNDVIAAMQWLATLDSRTCLLCAPLHGQTWKLVNGKAPSSMPRPPLHPRCRCFMSPVTKSWADLGFKVPNKAAWVNEPAQMMDFSSWLRRRPAAEQLDILGPTRREAWLSGAVPLDGFSDGRRILPLGALRARYNLSA